MPNIAQHHSSQTTKMLLIGNHSSGKTGSLCSLASAGYNLRILDLDNGVDIIKSMLLSPKSPYSPDSASRVHYVTLTDPYKKTGVGNAVRLIPQAKTWGRITDMIGHWKTEDEDLGRVQDWTEKDVLVIDSLSMLSKAAMSAVLAMNARLGQRPQLQDFGAGQDMVESVLELLYDENIRCNVVVIAHLTFIEDKSGITHAYPRAIGKALPPKIGQYFNSVVMVQSSGQGASIKQQLHTRTTGVIELKNSNPLKVQPTYPLETGLADFFRDVRGDLPVEPQVKLAGEAK